MEKFKIKVVFFENGNLVTGVWVASCCGFENGFLIIDKSEGGEVVIKSEFILRLETFEEKKYGEV